jgi:hypothetical protein
MLQYSDEEAISPVVDLDAGRIIKYQHTKLI